MLSWITALTSEIPINAMTMEKGRAPIIIAVLIAFNPPATSRTPMTRVRARPQTMMWWDFFCEASPAAEWC